MANSPKTMVDYTDLLNETFARQSAIAPVFDATATYAVGDVVMYQGKRYVCSNAHTGAWVAADFTAETINTVLSDKEDKPVVLTQTLAAGATTLTFTNSAFGNNSRIRAYSDPFVLGLFEDMSQSGTTVTLTCVAQANAVSVMLEVRN
jgi:hypothetical protein